MNSFKILVLILALLIVIECGWKKNLKNRERKNQKVSRESSENSNEQDCKKGKYQLLNRCRKCKLKDCNFASSCCESKKCQKKGKYSHWAVDEQNVGSCKCKKGYFQAGQVICTSTDVLVAHYSDKQKWECMNSFLGKLGLDTQESIYSKPELFQNILENDMQLNIPQVQDKLNISEPIDLQPMIKSISEGIVNGQPEIVEILCRIQEQNRTLPEKIKKLNEQREEVGQVDLQEFLTKTIHHTYLLEQITKMTVEDVDLMDIIVAQYLKRRNELGINTLVDIVKEMGLFGGIKLKTLDVNLKQMSGLRRAEVVTKEQEAGMRMSLNINIMEAILTDMGMGKKINAAAGLGLIFNPLKSLKFENKKLEYEFVPDWTSQYQSWNLNFVFERDYIDFLLSKLLIPIVNNADPKDYIFARAIALYHTINFMCFQKATNQTFYQIQLDDDIHNQWATINLKHSEKMTIDNRGIRIDAFNFFKDKMSNLGDMQGKLDQLQQMVLENKISPEALIDVFIQQIAGFLGLDGEELEMLKSDEL